MDDGKNIIFVVDDNESNLVACKQILNPIYTVYPIPSAAGMFELLQGVMPDMILLDVEMPEMNGYEAAKALKSSDEFRHIPVIFLTARDDAASEMEGLKLGALDYIHKPFVSGLLLKRIEMNLSLIDYQRILEEQNKSIVELLEIASRETLDSDPENREETEKERLKETLDFLVNYTLRHFPHEEKLQIRYKYPGYEQHKQYHEDFKATVSNLVLRFSQNKLTPDLISGINQYAMRSLMDHILRDDKKTETHMRSVAAT